MQPTPLEAETTTSLAERRRLRRPSGPAARLAHRLVASPTSVTLTTLVVYGVWICAVLALRHSPYAFMSLGRHYVQLAHRSGMALPALPSRYGGTAANPSLYGYDGQFTYYIALHPATAKNLVDVPWYRYQRILEPLLVKALALGNAVLVPWVMLALSWIAVVGGTWAMASWLRSRDRAPGWSLLFGFWPGLTVTVRHDLTDGIAYGLVAVALLALDSPKRPRPLLAAVLTGVAVFARQEVAIYAVMMALGIAVGVLPRQGSVGTSSRRYRLTLALEFGAIATIPFCLYLGFLSYWLRRTPGPIAAPQSKPAPEMVADLVMLVLPAVAALAAFVPGSIRRWRTPEVWAWSTYGVHVVALTGFMVVGQAGVYYSWSYSTVFRYYIPAALGALLCYGCINGLSRRRSVVLGLCFGLSMIGFPLLLATGL